MFVQNREGMMKQLAIILLAVLCIGATFEAIDKDTVLKTVVTETIVDLKALRAEIIELDNIIKDMPDSFEVPSGVEELKKDRDEKTDYLNSLSAISK